MIIYTKAKILTGTAVHSGNFGRIVALEDTVINTLTSDVISGTLSGVNLSSNVSIDLDILSIKLDSGSVIAYIR
tara:strand:+ start:199 stop:420 length:222 start_codon:yes stop_codon:yes gene_type:complete